MNKFSTLRKISLAVLALLLVAALWLWWTRPRRVEMSDYAPANALIYVEANDLPRLARAVTATDAWQTLAPLAEVDSRIPSGKPSAFDFYSLAAKWLAWTGVGTSEAVVLARAQTAFVVTGFDASTEDAAESGKSLNIKPHVAAVIESHTSERRLRSVIEKLAGDLARKAYGEVSFATVAQNDKNAPPLLIWTANSSQAKSSQANNAKSNEAKSNEARRIVAAVTETVAVIGNDESAVRACLAVRRGESSALSSDKNLSAMLDRVKGRDALAFGYVTPAGAARLAQVATLVYGSRLSSDPRLQSIAAVTLPQLAGKFVGSAAWSAHESSVGIEDTYFIALPGGLGARLRPALATDANAREIAASGANFAALLPASTYQFTLYTPRNPEAAWRALQAAVSSQLGDVTLQAVLGKLNVFDALLKPYGIDSPRDFLRAVNSPAATARLEAQSGAPLLLVSVRDRDALQTQIRKRLGAGAKTERIGDAEMMIARRSEEDENEAASFVGDFLIFGAVDDVRRCLEAHARQQTFAQTDAAKSLASATANSDDANSAAPNVITLTDDRKAAYNFVSLFGKRIITPQRVAQDAARAKEFNAHAYARSETIVADDGIEKRTRSSFGLFGSLVAQFAPKK